MSDTEYQSPSSRGDVGVIALVPDTWSDRWETRHQLLSRLARYFPVAWVEPRLPWRRAFGRVGGRGRTDTQAPQGIQVMRAKWYLPALYRSRRADDYFFAKQLQQAKKRLRAAGAQRTVLYVWRPRFARALELIDFDLSVYHIDDEYSFATEERGLDPTEVKLIQRSKQVFIHSERLLELKGHLNPNTLHVPNGVHYASFANPVPAPRDLDGIRPPILGYSGWLKDQLDWDLLCELARRHRKWSFVFAGGAKDQPRTRAAMAELGELDNVHFLGPKTSVELAAYPQHFDVCLLPYAVNAYTECISPLKLYESLAGGRPVVGAPIRSLREVHGIVHVARRGDEWSTVLTSVLAGGAEIEERRKAGRALARGHDWDMIAERVACAISANLDEAVRVASSQ